MTGGAVTIAEGCRFILRIPAVQYLPVAIVNVKRRLPRCVGIAERLVLRVIGTLAQELIGAGRRLTHFQQVNIVGIVDVTRNPTNGIGTFSPIADRVVFVRRRLRATITDDACNLARISAKGCAVRIRLTGVSVPDSIFKRCFLARGYA